MHTKQLFYSITYSRLREFTQAWRVDSDILIMTKRLSLLILIMLHSVPLIFAGEEEGEASWYGGQYHGRQTASGEIFNTYDLTAAHKTLPFGTEVEVTNLDNGKTVVVRINDRGPFIEGRIIDLSYGAANRLDMIRAGVARVRIEWNDQGSELAQQQFYTIQVAAFRDGDNALALKHRLESMGLQPETELNNQGVIRIYLRNVPEEESFIVISRLENMGLTDLVIRQD